MKSIIRIGMIVVGWSVGFAFSGPTGLFISRISAIKVGIIALVVVGIASFTTKVVNRKPVKKRW
jgi:hypothetical protein